MEQIIKSVLLGEKGAATKFYHAYEKRLRRYLQSKLPEEAVEEILQDTFLAAFDSLNLYRGESGIYTWLVAIARHEIADYYRKRFVRLGVEKTAPLFESMVSEILSPEFVYEKHKIERKFKKTYLGLSKQYQDILSYRYELSMSVKEIADRMELPFKATESMLYRARIAFREAYERD